MSEPETSAVAGAASFQASGDSYDSFMGRYSRPLARAFVDAVGLAAEWRVLDVGCGPGALTEELCTRLGTSSVAAFDPSPPFVEACSARCPGVDVRAGRAEAIPFDAASFHAALAQLVLHFVSDPAAAGVEMRRVVRPGGVVAACVWDFAAEMEMLRCFWDAALAVDGDAPDEAHVMRFGREGELTGWLIGAGCRDVVEGTIESSSTYRDFDELWAGFLAGIGPAGAYCVGLDEGSRVALRRELFERLGRPSGSFTLGAVARYARGVT